MNRYLLHNFKMKLMVPRLFDNLVLHDGRRGQVLAIYQKNNEDYYLIKLTDFTDDFYDKILLSQVKTIRNE